MRKKIVGATENIQLVQPEERDFDFKARIDTGAETCSIHAVDIEVDTPDNPKGKPILFRTTNKDDQSQKVKTNVHSVIIVNTSEGKSRRYKVPLTLKWNGSKKTVLVTLNDRQKMKYHLLIGRNWLCGEYLVDVDRNNDD